MRNKVYKYRLVAVGGTFDHLHKGHASLLNKALVLGERVVIGIADGELVKDKSFPWALQSYNERKKELEQYLGVKKVLSRILLVHLTDPYGPLKQPTNIEAVIVGPDIPQDRIEKVAKSFAVIACMAVRADDGALLTSSRIREGMVDRSGAVFVIPNNTLRLPKALRAELRKPLGVMHSKKHILNQVQDDAKIIITVGDESTRAATNRGVLPDVAIVDFKVQRKMRYTSLDELGISGKEYTVVRVKNPAGQLTPALFDEVRRSLERHTNNAIRTAVIVDGEDDLAVLPYVMSAPLESVIYYGQPNEGIVEVRVTEERKAFIKELLNKFHNLRREKKIL